MLVDERMNPCPSKTGQNICRCCTIAVRTLRVQDDVLKSVFYAGHSATGVSQMVGDSKGVRGHCSGSGYLSRDGTDRKKE